MLATNQVFSDGKKDLYRKTKSYLDNLITNEGIPASADLRFHHDFCRDTFKNARNIYLAHQNYQDSKLYAKTKSSVFRFWKFQRTNGRLPHEIRKFDKEVFKKSKGFYYKEGDLLINDDTIDGTPLALIVTALFIDTPKELESIKPKAKKALDWMLENMKKHDGWLSYKPTPGGLTHHGWMDSIFGTVTADLHQPINPIALAEAQAYSWKALLVWSEILKDRSLKGEALNLQKKFNEHFVIKNDMKEFQLLAHALHAKSKAILTPSINQAMSLTFPHNDRFIMDLDHAYEVGIKLTSSAMFNPNYGIKTFEKNIGGDGYHLGHHEDVYWLFATHEAIIALLNLADILKINKKNKEARKIEIRAKDVMKANLDVVNKLGFREQFKVRDGKTISFYGEGTSELSCIVQTWTVTSIWNILNHPLARDIELG